MELIWYCFFFSTRHSPRKACCCKIQGQMSEYHKHLLHVNKVAEQAELWGECNIQQVFCLFLLFVLVLFWLGGWGLLNCSSIRTRRYKKFHSHEQRSFYIKSNFIEKKYCYLENQKWPIVFGIFRYKVRC